MLTRFFVLSAVNEIVQLTAKWEAADGPNVNWRGGVRKCVPDKLATVWTKLFDEVATMDAESDAKPIVLAIDEFQDHVESWGESCTIDPDNTDPRGNVAMWSAWAAVVEASKIVPPPAPEAIQTLEKNGVSDRQIAIIYGWKDASGEWNVNMVREERENPGTHYDPSTWVHPSLIRRRLEIETQWESRSDRVDQQVASQYVQRSAPETIEELIRQGVGSKQIAKMKNVDVESVKSLAADLRLPLDGQFVRRATPEAKLEQMRTDEANRDAELAEAMNVESELLEAVLVRHLAGKKPGEIAAELQTAGYPDLTYQRVGKLIAEAEANVGTAPTVA